MRWHPSKPIRAAAQASRRPINVLEVAIGPIGWGRLYIIGATREAVNYIRSIQNEFPNANITLTGLSLGGSIAQIIGEATGYTTVAFNAPGAGGNIYANLQDDVPGITTLAQSDAPGGNTNYRIYGDVISQFGAAIGTQTTLKGDSSIVLSPVVSPSSNLDAEGAELIHNIAYFDAAHNISNFLDSNFAPISDVGEPDVAPAVETALQEALKPTSITLLTLVGQEQLLFQFTLTAADVGILKYLDPDSSNQFVLLESPGSPFFTSVDLPTSLGLGSFNFR